MTNYSQWFLCC